MLKTVLVNNHSAETHFNPYGIKQSYTVFARAIFFMGHVL